MRSTLRLIPEIPEIHGSSPLSRNGAFVTNLQTTEITLKRIPEIPEIRVPCPFLPITGPSGQNSGQRKSTLRPIPEIPEIRALPAPPETGPS